MNGKIHKGKKNNVTIYGHSNHNCKTLELCCSF